MKVTADNYEALLDESAAAIKRLRSQIPPDGIKVFADSDPGYVKYWERYHKAQQMLKSGTAPRVTPAFARRLLKRSTEYGNLITHIVLAPDSETFKKLVAVFNGLIRAENQLEACERWERSDFIKSDGRAELNELDGEDGDEGDENEGAAA